MRLLDLFCGRWGWSRAFAARGWECVGVDLVEPPEIPQGCRFIKADILKMWVDVGRGTLWFNEWECLPWPSGYFPNFICASPPCEQFSVHGMKHFHPNPPYPELGIKLFNHTREICEASGVPYVIENVRAAQQFVGRAMHHCGPFYLWGSGVPPIVAQGVSKAKWTMQADRPGNACPESKWPKSRRKPQLATIPPELSACVCSYAERLLEQRQVTA